MRWSREAAAEAAGTTCFWSRPCGTILQLAAEEAARRNGNREVQQDDWFQAVREIRDGANGN